jgi:hypothetical protein
MAAVTGVSGVDSSRTTTPSDKRARLVSGSARRDVTVWGAGSCWAGMASEPGPNRRPRPFSIIFVQTIFPFLFLKQKALFCNKICIDLNLYKFAKFVKWARGFFELNKTQTRRKSKRKRFLKKSNWLT